MPLGASAVARSRLTDSGARGALPSRSNCPDPAMITAAARTGRPAGGRDNVPANETIAVQAADLLPAAEPNSQVVGADHQECHGELLLCSHPQE